MIRPALLAAATLGATLASPAGGFGISQSSYTINVNGSMPLCLQRARDILGQSGLRVLSTGGASVGAETEDGRVLVTIFCLPHANAVVMTAAGSNTNDTAPVLERVRTTVQAAGEPVAPAGRATK